MNILHITFYLVNGVKLRMVIKQKNIIKIRENKHVLIRGNKFIKKTQKNGVMQKTESSLEACITILVEEFKIG